MHFHDVMFCSVRFEEYIDLRPYLAHSLGLNAPSHIHTPPHPIDAYQYTLSAVVNHKGAKSDSALFLIGRVLVLREAWIDWTVTNRIA